MNRLLLAITLALLGGIATQVWAVESVVVPLADEQMGNPPPPPPDAPPGNPAAGEQMDNLPPPPPDAQLGAVPPGREGWQNMTPEERQQRMQQMRRNAQSAIGGRNDFVTRYLRDNEEFIKLNDKYLQTTRDILQELRELSEAARTKLADENLTKEEKDQLIADTKKDARVLLGKLLDEQLTYQQAVTDLAIKYKEEILDKAADAVFTKDGQVARQPQPGMGPAPVGNEGGQPANPQPRNDHRPRGGRNAPAR